MKNMKRKPVLIAAAICLAGLFAVSSCGGVTEETTSKSGITVQTGNASEKQFGEKTLGEAAFE